MMIFDLHYLKKIKDHLENDPRYDLLTSIIRDKVTLMRANEEFR